MDGNPSVFVQSKWLTSASRLIIVDKFVYKTNGENLNLISYTYVSLIHLNIWKTFSKENNAIEEKHMFPYLVNLLIEIELKENL